MLTTNGKPYGVTTNQKGRRSVRPEPVEGPRDYGKGTTFRVYLPIVSAREDLRRQPENDLELTRGTETILQAENEQGVRELVDEVLSALGYEVIPASDGAEAIKTAETLPVGSIEMLISEVVMPFMDEPAVADRIAGRHAGIEMLFISGSTTA